MYHQCIVQQYFVTTHQWPLKSGDPYENEATRQGIWSGQAFRQDFFGTIKVHPSVHRHSDEGCTFAWCFFTVRHPQECTRQFMSRGRRVCPSYSYTVHLAPSGPGGDLCGALPSRQPGPRIRSSSPLDRWAAPTQSCRGCIHIGLTQEPTERRTTEGSRISAISASWAAVGPSPRSAGTCPSCAASEPSAPGPSPPGPGCRRRCSSLSPPPSCRPSSGRASWARPGWRSRRCWARPFCDAPCRTCCRGPTGWRGGTRRTRSWTSLLFLCERVALTTRWGWVAWCAAPRQSSSCVSEWGKKRLDGIYSADGAVVTSAGARQTQAPPPAAAAENTLCELDWVWYIDTIISPVGDWSKQAGHCAK